MTILTLFHGFFSHRNQAKKNLKLNMKSKVQRSTRCKEISVEPKFDRIVREVKNQNITKLSSRKFIEQYKQIQSKEKKFIPNQHSRSQYPRDHSPSFSLCLRQTKTKKIVITIHKNFGRTKQIK